MKKAAGHRFVQTIQESEKEKAQEMQGPKPENAPNRTLMELFGHPQFHALADPKVKEKVINFYKILNKRKIQITMLRSLAFRGIPGEVRSLRRIVW
jgi:hypothetical protein